MIRLLALSACLVFLAGCNKSPEEKIGEAQEDLIDAKADAQEERQEVIQDLGEKREDLSQSQDAANRDIRESQEQVRDASENMAQVQAEIAKDKADAQAKLNDKLRDLEERVAKLAQRPANTDPAEQSKFTQTMSLINTDLADARSKVTDFAQVSPTEWQGPYETANNALAKLDDSIDKIE